MKNRINLALIVALIILSGVTVFSQPADAKKRVFETLTLDKPAINANFADQLKNTAWESLAYWDMTTTKAIENMEEAVGDVFRFGDDKFTLQLRDPNAVGAFLPDVKGTYTWRLNTLMMIVANGNNLEAKVFYLDENYMVLEMLGMRLFYLAIKY